MKEKQPTFSIIFTELDRLSKEEQDLVFTAEDLEEYDEIEALREIVSEIQEPQQNYFTST